MLFTEDFLHYVWKFRLFDRTELKTAEGESIEIYSAGIHNTDAGPDFQNARIKIGDTTWAGNVEIHVPSSDWRKHNHNNDRAYDNVILHVVYRDDEPVILPNGRRLPTLELENRINPDLYNRFHSLIYGNQSIIPCEGSIGHVDDMTIKTWLTRVLVERLEKRAETVIHALNVNRGDWEETFYQFLAANFGFKTNALPFENADQIVASKYSREAQKQPDADRGISIWSGRIFRRRACRRLPQKPQKRVRFPAKKV